MSFKGDLHVQQTPAVTEALPKLPIGIYVMQHINKREDDQNVCLEGQGVIDLKSQMNDVPGWSEFKKKKFNFIW